MGAEAEAPWGGERLSWLLFPLTIPDKARQTIPVCESVLGRMDVGEEVAVGGVSTRNG